MAPATRPIVVVSHGSPSDPEPQEAFVSGIATRVAGLTGLDVRGATLAKSGSLDAAVSGLSAPVIYPLFMSDGWFVSTALQNRLKDAGLAHWRTATPLGMDDRLPKLALRRLRLEMTRFEAPPGLTTLVLLAHGSPSDPRPSRATRAFAAALDASDMFREIRVGFVDEAPSIQDAATTSGPAIALPFFAARAGHVLMDVPEAIEAARFEGPVLDPIGAWDHIPNLIAGALRAELDEDAA